VVVQHEDAQVGRVGELLLDPVVAAAADLPVVEVGLGRVDGDDRDAVLAQRRVAVTEEVVEMDVPDVARVVVAGDDDERLARDLVQILARLLILGTEAEGREVSRADDDRGVEVVDLVDRALQQAPRSECRRCGRSGSSRPASGLRSLGSLSI
jgi:hypothetical protein